jgi:hypothetical protein
MTKWGICASVSTSVTKLGRINGHVSIDNLAQGVLMNTDPLKNAPFTGALLVLIKVAPKPSVDVMNVAIFTE